MNSSQSHVADGGANSVHRAANQPTVVGLSDYVPGMRGIRGSGAAAPGGVTSMLDLTSRSRMRRNKKTPPMERAEVLTCVQKARDLYSEYLLRVRGTAMTDAETYPKLLLLIVALYHVDKRTQYHALRSMAQQTWQISTNRPVTTMWDGQPYDCVEWEVRTFPTSVAISILQLAEQHIYADSSYGEEVLVVSERGRPQNAMRLLQDSERVIARCSKWREPTEDELNSVQHVASLDGVSAKLSGAAGGKGILFSFGGEEDLPQQAAQQAPPYDPNAQQVQQQAPAEAAQYNAPASAPPEYGDTVAGGGQIANPTMVAQPQYNQPAPPTTPPGAIQGPAGGEYAGNDGVSQAYAENPVI